MTKAKIIEKPAKKPRVKRRKKKKPPEEVPMSGKDQDPPVNGQDNQQHKEVKEESMNNGDLTVIAKKIHGVITKEDGGLTIDDSHRSEIGQLLFSGVFGDDRGVLEQHRMIAPHYLNKHPEYQTYKKNWEELIDKLKDLRKETDSVREWKAIERKLKIFYRSMAVAHLAVDKGHKANTIREESLIELQRERYHKEVIEKCIPVVISKDMTEAQTRNLRRELAKTFKREKRLERADKLHRRVDSLIDSLNFAIDDEPITFRDLARLKTEDKEQLVDKLEGLRDRLTEASQYVANVLQFIEINSPNGKGKAGDAPVKPGEIPWNEILLAKVTEELDKRLPPRPTSTT
jgi:hypothetical protein